MERIDQQEKVITELQKGILRLERITRDSKRECDRRISDMEAVLLEQFESKSEIGSVVSSVVPRYVSLSEYNGGRSPHTPLF